MSIRATKPAIKTIYVLPSTETIERYAYEVCKKLGDDHLKTDVFYGFTTFMKKLMVMIDQDLNDHP